MNPFLLIALIAGVGTVLWVGVLAIYSAGLRKGYKYGLICGKGECRHTKAVSDGD